MIKIQIARFDDGRPAVVITDPAEFEAKEPPGFTRDVRRAIEVDGRFYLLAGDCPDDGIGEWAETSPEHVAKDAAIIEARSRLTAGQLAALKLDGVKTRAEAVAQKMADDAEAEQRKADAEAAKL